MSVHLHIATPITLVNSVVNELALLASQHHTSEYNRLKFGPKGCPTTYIPLSIHLPDYVLELKQRQRQSAEAQAWWPSDKTSISPFILGSCGAQPQDARLEQEIQAAMTESIQRPSNLDDFPGPSFHQTKTSSTHPINISFMIPQELIPLISSHLFLATGTPTIFEIPYSFTLDRLLTSYSNHQQPLQPDLHATTNTYSVLESPRTRTSVTHALHAALNGTFFQTDGKGFRSFSPDDVLPSEAFAIDCPYASSISSLSLTMSDPVQALGPRDVNPGFTDATCIFGETTTNTYKAQPPLNIGNLLISSCPGKKVRLEGPIKGRSRVCRDLNLDLRRIKELGVGCIICCLDDGELDFLGAPWPEYENTANENGIDVFRMPIPEGLAPLSTATFDTNLTKIISEYTLHGVPVLVHCRGGVGRAGVIACCWLIRLGLCGWVEPRTASLERTSSCSSGKAAGPTADPTALTSLGRDTVQFVNKVISVARRRRSLKAVETYEQVRFLVEFVEYLRKDQSRATSPSLTT